MHQDGVGCTSHLDHGQDRASQTSAGSPERPPPGTPGRSLLALQTLNVNDVSDEMGHQIPGFLASGEVRQSLGDRASSRYFLILSRFAPRLENCFSLTSL